MLFNSFAFLLVFLPITYIGSLLLELRRHARARIAWLALTSLFFYGYWEPRHLPLIIASLVFNYWLGARIRPDRPSTFRRLLLILGVTANLGLIGYFKYIGFFTRTLADLGADIPVMNVLLPIGISFYTFQKIAYLIDSYRGDVTDHDFVGYSAFVLFFPQLIAGPIVHHSELLPQLIRPLPATTTGIWQRAWDNVAVGTCFLSIGLAKKVLIADPIARAIAPLFAQAEHAPLASCWLSLAAGLGFTLQLYFDFSGYSDMAIGLARLFGVDLPFNFHSPLRQRNIIDFWRTWHMTLSRFLRDYLYIPLGGNRSGPRRRYVNLFLTMLIGGLWHGAGWNFLLWGALHGSFLIVNHAYRALRGPSSNPNALASAASWVLTFACVCLAFVFFRATTFTGALNVLIGFSRFTSGIPLERLPLLLALAALVAFVLLAPNSQEWVGRGVVLPPTHLGPAGITQAPPLRWAHTFRLDVRYAVLIGLFFGISFLGLGRVSEFLYFQF